MALQGHLRGGTCHLQGVRRVSRARCGRRGAESACCPRCTQSKEIDNFFFCVCSLLKTDGTGERHTPHGGSEKISSEKTLPPLPPHPSPSLSPLDLLGLFLYFREIPKKHTLRTAKYEKNKAYEGMNMSCG